MKANFYFENFILLYASKQEFWVSMTQTYKDLESDNNKLKICRGVSLDKENHKILW